MTNCVIYAIPSYNRLNGIIQKTLSTLHRYHIPKNDIYIFVNTDEQKEEYLNGIPKHLYGHIIATKQQMSETLLSISLMKTRSLFLWMMMFHQLIR